MELRCHCDSCRLTAYHQLPAAARGRKLAQSSFSGEKLAEKLGEWDCFIAKLKASLHG